MVASFFSLQSGSIIKRSTGLSLWLSTMRGVVEVVLQRRRIDPRQLVEVDASGLARGHSDGPHLVGRHATGRIGPGEHDAWMGRSAPLGPGAQARHRVAQDDGRVVGEEGVADAGARELPGQRVQLLGFRLDGESDLLAAFVGGVEEVWIGLPAELFHELAQVAGHAVARAVGVLAEKEGLEWQELFNPFPTTAQANFSELLDRPD